jgi:hypothetical protein
MPDAQSREGLLVQDARRFSELTEKKRHLQAELRNLNQELSQVESDLIEGMVAANMQNMTIRGFNLYLYNRLSVRAKDSDHVRLARALFDCGREDLLIVGSQRLRSEVREEEDLESLPPQIREAVTVERISKVGARKTS